MNLNLLKHPITLSTTRLNITSMTDEDWPLFRCLQSDPKLMKFIGPLLDESVLREKFINRIKPWEEDESHWLTLKIVEEQTNNPVGSIGFRLSDISNKRAEIGYLLLQNQQGKGFVVEAGLALLSYLFDEVAVEKIEAHCYLENTPSWKVMEKLGMKREGLLRSHSILNNIRVDDLSYGILSPTLTKSETK